MALNMFLTMNPLEGESQDKVLSKDNAMDILAWSWGLSNDLSAASPSRGGRANFQDMSITKYVDTASMGLSHASASGTLFKEAVITVNRGAGRKAVQYLQYTLSDVFVTSVSTGGSGCEDQLTENVTLNYGEIEVQYFELNEEGDIGDTPKFSWDLGEHKGKLA